MKKSFQVLLLILLLIACVALSALYISTQNVAVLEPKGMIGEKQRDLIYIASILMFIIVIPVFIMTFAFAWRYRKSNKTAKYTPDWDHQKTAEFLWWGVPFVVIVILGFFTWKTSHELNPFKPIENGKKPIVIQAVALEWKWLFIYPEEGIATVNYVQFPENTPIAFEITADAPMNSFWIPQLGGQIYAMPAMRTKLHLLANEPGEFQGTSANLSGKGFAGMKFTAKASTQEEFRSWIQQTKGSANHLNWSEYERLVKPSEYNRRAFYVLDHNDLFDRIIMQYGSPQKGIE